MYVYTDMHRNKSFKADIEIQILYMNTSLFASFEK